MTFKTILDNPGRMSSETDLLIFMQALQATNEGVLITDNRLPDNPIIFVNHAFEKLTGYTQGEILNRNCRFLQNDDRDQNGLHVIRKALQEGKSCRVQLRNYKKDGTLFWNELCIAPLFGKDQEITHFVGIQRDLTRQKLLEEALFSQAMHDPLTQLYNRRGFFREARRMVLTARRLSINLLVVMIDIDHFKKINDSFGHTAGDLVLESFGSLLKETQRETDLTARYGGDEFVLILFEDNSFSYQSWLSRLRENITSLEKSHQLPCSFTISHGKSHILYSSTKALIGAIKEADEAMYEEKKIHASLIP